MKDPVKTALFFATVTIVQLLLLHPMQHLMLYLLGMIQHPWYGFGWMFRLEHWGVVHIYPIFCIVQLWAIVSYYGVMHFMQRLSSPSHGDLLSKEAQG